MYAFIGKVKLNKGTLTISCKALIIDHRYDSDEDLYLLFVINLQSEVDY